MVQEQILNKILQTRSIGLIRENGLTTEYFLGNEDEYQFILDHFEKYGTVPDDTTMLEKFNDFEIFNVKETDSYLLDKIYEEKTYVDMVTVVNNVAEYMKTDSTEAVDYLRGALPSLQTKMSVDSVDIISRADERYLEYADKQRPDNKWSIPTGFDALDDTIGGLERGEEFVLIFARTGVGKSWVLLKMGVNAWKEGYRVGYISPEMSPTKIGYRFDTLVENISNTSLTRGYDVELEGGGGYKDYIDELKVDEVPLFISTPKDFNRKITVSKLRNFIVDKKLDVLLIDGISYLADERGRPHDNKTTALTNISENLMDLSIELSIPIVVVSQSNRTGVKAKDDDSGGTPEIESVRDSDGISYNTSKIISLSQRGTGLEMGVKKNRNGRSKEGIVYVWDIDVGKFTYLPNEDEAKEYGNGGMPLKKRRAKGDKKKDDEVVF